MRLARTPLQCPRAGIARRLTFACFGSGFDPRDALNYGLPVRGTSQLIIVLCGSTVEGIRSLAFLAKVLALLLALSLVP
jgi:hypothetical protein